MGEVVDFVHYLNTGEIMPVDPCGKGGHNYRHIRMFEVADKFFIYCNLCREGALGLVPEDFYAFAEGYNPEWICERPYHHPKHVIKGEDGENICRKCMVVVRKAEHPSHSGKKWYG